MTAKENFEPELSLHEIEYLFEGPLQEKEIKSGPAYNTVEKLTEKAFPTSETKFEKKWEDFYLPMERDGELISIPFSIVKYERDFYCYFQFLGRLKVTEGEGDGRKIYKKIFEEALRFLPLIKSSGEEVIKETVPYDYRIGKIKGKYVMNEVMPEKEREELMSSYKKHLERDMKITQTALKDYLDVAAICYRAAYDEAEDLSPLKMYKKWADGRHGGMLEIDDPSSEKEFGEWQRGGRQMGSHPFEIVFSGWGHGIHLYPPSKDNSFYSIGVTNYSYSRKFIEMVKALIKNKIPFRALDLEDVLDFLGGEKYWNVNGYENPRFIYIPSEEHRKRYFKHIDWEELEMVKLKEDTSQR